LQETKTGQEALAQKSGSIPPGPSDSMQNIKGNVRQNVSQNVKQDLKLAKSEGFNVLEEKTKK